MEEKWRDIKGYEGFYQVSNFGNVRSVERIVVKSNGVVQISRSREMAVTKNPDGYLTVKLSKDGHSERIAVHRLVAIAFVPNPHGLSDVNHIDFDRTNARADNLEWLSHKDNVHYTIDAGRHHCNRDLFGKNNPNFGGTKLKKYFADNPSEKMKLSRPGGQNGRSQSVKLIFDDGSTKKFDFIRGCARYLINNGICETKSENYVADRIVSSMKSGKPYCNCHFSKE